MTNFDRLPPPLLRRKAVVYVRQSTQTQVQMNLESEPRQYELVDEAKRRGFRDSQVIDADLGGSVMLSNTQDKANTGVQIAITAPDSDVCMYLCEENRPRRRGCSWSSPLILRTCGTS